MGFMKKYMPDNANLSLYFFLAACVFSYVNTYANRKKIDSFFKDATPETKKIYKQRSRAFLFFLIIINCLLSLFV